MGDSVISELETKQVSVAPARLAHWVDSFWVRHGQGAVSPTEHGVTLSAPDGVSAQLTTRWPGWAGSDLSDFIAHAFLPRDFGILLVRRASCAVAVVRDGKIVAHRTVRNYVQGRTKAGGWSQQRFQRRRDNQSSKASQKAVAAADEVIDARGLAAIIVGGDRAMVEDVLAAPRIRRLADLTRIWVPGHVPNPNFAVIQQAANQIVKVEISVAAPTPS